MVLNDIGCQHLVNSTARLVHPDKNPGHNDAKEAFQKVMHAFDILRETSTRHAYDDDILSEVFALQVATKQTPIRAWSSGAAAAAAAKHAPTKRAKTSTAASSTSLLASWQTLFGSIDLCKVADISTTPNDTSCGLCFVRPCFGHVVVVKFIRPGNSTRASKNKSPQWLQTRSN